MSNEAEGFICPYCLVGFATSSKLQGHFVEMHSGQSALDEIDYSNGEEETSFGADILGHEFKVVRQSRPKTCDGCGEIIWQDALVCQTCQVTIHEESCKLKLNKPCTDSGDNVYEPVEAPDPTVEERRSSITQGPKGILPLVRRQIAKSPVPLPEPKYPMKITQGRDRYVNEEFDLDLTYITERIIAMSFPATGVESAYRNNLKDVAKMLKTKHEDNYMVFNLSERSYDISRFNNQVLDFGWPDHLAPSLERLSSVCKSIKSWLDSDPLHVAVVHCKGGKGRTGCVIAAFMHYSEICHSAAAALDRFAMKRFYDNKLGGVTQPSQRKYVHYFADLLTGKIDLKAPPVVLQHVLIHGIPNFDGKGGCRPFLKVYENMKLVYTSGLYVCNSDKERVKITVYGGLKLQGEVLVKCHHKKVHTGIDSIFRCQFHTAVVGEELRLVYKKTDLDDAYKDKRFGDNVRVELLFESIEEYNATGHDDGDIRISLLEAKKSSSGGSGMNGLGDMSIHNDTVANRDSYAGFRGGYDNGMADERADNVPDLISLDSPTPSHRPSSRDRSVSNESFKMDPEAIERVAHPSSEQVYTVVNRSSGGAFKPVTPNERGAPRSGQGIKTHSSSPDIIERPGSSAAAADRRKLQLDGLNKRHSAANMPSAPTPKARPSTPGGGSGVGPRHPPPPRPTRRPGQRQQQQQQQQQQREPLSSTAEAHDADEHDYSDVPDEFSSPSPEPLSPLRQTSPPNPPPSTTTSHSSQYPKPPVAARRSKEDLFSSGAKPAPPKKLGALAIGKGGPSPSSASASSGGFGGVQQQPPAGASARAGSPFRVPLLPPVSARPLSPQRRPISQVSPEPPKQQQQQQQQQQPQAPSPTHAKSRHRPSYTEVDPDQEIRVEPLPARMSATDNDMWVKVKYNTAGRQPNQDSLGRRSSSSSNLTNTMTSASGSDCYSNLAELMINVTAPSTPGSSGQRRHSFTEGDGKLIIKASATNRDSIIPLGGPDYKNVGYDEDGQLNIDGELVPKTHNYENQDIAADKDKPGATRGAAAATENMFYNPGLYDPDMDYMNQDPEGLFHTYTNQDDLLQQVRAENQPVASESVRLEEPPAPTDHTPQTRVRVGSNSSIVRKLLEKVVKSKQPQTIHSGTISEEERHSTLAPFAMPGISIGQVNRDYEAFFKTAWGSSPTSAPKTSAANLPQPSVSSAALVQAHSQHGQAKRGERDHREGSRRERRTEQPSRSHRPVNIAGGGGRARAFTSEDDLKEKHSSSRSPPRSPQLRKALQLNTPEEPRPGRLPSPPAARRPPVHKPLAKKPSAPHVLGGGGGGPPLPAPRQHSRLVATNSDGARSKGPIEERPTARKKNVPPPKPPPYIHQRPQSEAINKPLSSSSLHGHKPQSESTVKAQMPYWYRPQFSREEAISFVRSLDPGSFIVRDSTTVPGGYAITIKISQDQVRQRKKMSEAAQVTEDMLVTHFLIQPDPEGVKLQGWNERAFKTLPEFIAHHTVEKLCLPCKLVLPKSSAGSGGVPQVRRKPAGMKQALQTGAVCELVYLGSVEVSGPGSESVVRETVEQLKTLGLSTMNIVTFKASMSGITLTDDINGMYIKRQYPMSSITYCGLDPNDTRWDFPNLQHLGEMISLSNKPCFGLVLRPPDSTGNTCLVFAEFDSSQPVTSVVNYLQRAMRSR